MYSCHLFIVSSASVRSLPFLSFIVPILEWNVPLVFLTLLKRSPVFLTLLFSSVSHHWSLRTALSLLVILWTLHSDEYIFPFLFSLQYLLTLLAVIKSAFSSCCCLIIQLDIYIYKFFTTPVFYSISFNNWHCLTPTILNEEISIYLNDFHFLSHFYIVCRNSPFPGDSAGKEFICNVEDLGSIPGLRRSPEGGHGNPLQYSYLENPHRQKSLADYSPWDRKELHTTEQVSMLHIFVANKKTEGCFLKFPEEWGAQKCLSLSFWYRWNYPVWGHHGFCPTVLWFWILMFENILNFILRR